MRRRLYQWSDRLINKGYSFLCLPVKMSLFLLAGIFFQQCGSDLRKPQVTLLTLTIENAYNQEIILERKGLFSVHDSIIRKIHPTGRVETISIPLTDSMESMYYIRSSDARLSVYLINDSKTIDARVDYMDPSNRLISGSPATNSLYAYFASVESVQHQQKPGASPFGISQSGAAFNRIAYNYVDTVASPAAALMIYNSIDFGKDFEAVKSFVTKLANRFPAHPGIQELKTRTLDYIGIFEKDLVKGQQAAPIQLTDTANQTHSINYGASDLTLIDICSSWYGPCILRYKSLKNVREAFSDTTLQMISVSLDADRNDWANSVKYLKPQWLQLRDSLIWQGPMLKNYLFDSIPYNFLVSKEGRVLDYAIPVDSLTIKIRGYLR